MSSSNVEPERELATAAELLRYTNLTFATSRECEKYRTIALRNPGAEHYLIRSRKYPAENPFASYNDIRKAAALPNTRLETFVFSVNDIKEYVRIQKSRGVRFVTDDIIHADNYFYIQTVPSVYTGNSTGFIQWHGERGNFLPRAGKPTGWTLAKPAPPYLKNIGRLDHAATRVKSQDRNDAIIEFMRLTNYNFDFAVYMESLNSITTVARLSDKDFALVFTSGISPYMGDEKSGPTEMFIHNYGVRTHHLAYDTQNIEDTIAAIKSDGMGFLIELVGSPEEGLKQCFTNPSPNSMLVTEYIHRYGGFRGFFTRSNVTLLTASTAKQ